MIGFGYATNSFKLPFRIGGEQRVLRNELTARLDLSIRDNYHRQRSIVDVVDPNEPYRRPTPARWAGPSAHTNGTRQMQLRPTVDYVLNQRLNLQFFFTQTITTPRRFRTPSTTPPPKAACSSATVCRSNSETDN